MRLFFSAGEASGDAYAAALLEKIRSRAAQALDVEAIGGRKIRSAGAGMVADSSDWGAIGIAESLKVVPRARRGLAVAKKAIAKGKPGVFVPIDYGFFNIGLARYAKSLGWKVVYFSPPGAWRRDKQGEDLPEISDAVITPFSWSAEILNKMGAKAHWFGHPIKQMIRDQAMDDVRRTRYETRIAILPGSRKSEIDLLLPVFAKALESFSEKAEFAVASSLDLNALRAKWKSLASKRDDHFTTGDTYSVLRRARVAIVCSGTATLEAALCRCPHVVVYKVSKAVELQAAIARLKVPLIAQPNILLERMVVPELIQRAATPEAIARELRQLLDNEERRKTQLAAFEALEKILGPDDAIDKSAELVVGML